MTFCPFPIIVLLTVTELDPGKLPPPALYDLKGEYFFSEADLTPTPLFPAVMEL